VAARYTWIELRPRHLSIVAVVLVVVALPAAAHASYFRIVNHETSWCLEADMAGDAYLNPCAPDNALQVWERWDGGWTRNLATGLCLRGEGQFSPGSIHAAPCVWNDPRANWLHWYGGWYQRAEFVAGGVSAAAAVVVRVRAPVRVRASSRSLRNGQTLVLRGRLGGHLRTRGLLVEFQVRRGRSWSTFATSRTVRAGRFRYAYRFTRTFGVQTYRFRARLPAQRGSPFSTGSSRRVTVRVVG
jgi:hypothetical protein